MKKQEPELGLFEIEFHTLSTRYFFIEGELEIIEDELTYWHSYVDGLLNPTEVLWVRFLYFGEKKRYFFVVGGKRRYLVDHVDEVIVILGLQDHFLVDGEPRLCKSRVLDTQLIFGRSLGLRVAHTIILIILNVIMEASFDNEGKAKLCVSSSDSKLSLLQLAVLLPQVEKLLPCPLHLELQFLKLWEVHLGACFLDYIMERVLNSLLSSLRLSQIYSSFC